MCVSNLQPLVWPLLLFLEKTFKQGIVIVHFSAVPAPNVLPALGVFVAFYEKKINIYSNLFGKYCHVLTPPSPPPPPALP